MDDFVRDASVIGAASGAVAAVPGPDTAVEVMGGNVVETGVFLERASYMIMGVAEAYGLGHDELEVRRYAVLRVLGAWAGTSQGATGLAGTLGAGLGRRATEAIPMTAIHAFKGDAQADHLQMGFLEPAPSVGLGVGLRNRHRDRQRQQLLHRQVLGPRGDQRVPPIKADLVDSGSD